MAGSDGFVLASTADFGSVLNAMDDGLDFGPRRRTTGAVGSVMPGGGGLDGILGNLGGGFDRSLDRGASGGMSRGRLDINMARNDDWFLAQAAALLMRKYSNQRGAAAVVESIARDPYWQQEMAKTRQGLRHAKAADLGGMALFKPPETHADVGGPLPLFDLSVPENCAMLAEATGQPIAPLTGAPLSPQQRAGLIKALREASFTVLQEDVDQAAANVYGLFGGSLEVAAVQAAAGKPGLAMATGQKTGGIHISFTLETTTPNLVVEHSPQYSYRPLVMGRTDANGQVTKALPPGRAKFLSRQLQPNPRVDKGVHLVSIASRSSATTDF